MVSTLAEKLEAKKAELAKLQTKAGVTHSASNRATPGGVAGYDSAVLSGIRRKPNHKKDAQRFAAYDREASAYAALTECEADVARLEALIEREQKNAPVPFTSEELRAARAIRTSLGWHKVAKVNAKSVSVETGYSWTDRYTLDKVLEVRA